MFFLEAWKGLDLRNCYLSGLSQGCGVEIFSYQGLIVALK